MFRGATASVLGSILLGLISTTGAAELPVRPVGEPPTEPEEIVAGTFLVARREMADPNFTKTVVLMLRHDDKGSTGLIINRPTDTRLSQLLPDIEDPGGRRDLVFEGGPVARNRVVMLLRSAKPVDGARHVFEDVYMSRSEELLRSLSETGRSYRVYAGHAGWAPGQLAAEIERGDWHVRYADAEMVFDQSPHEIWKLLLPRDPTRSAQTMRSRAAPDAYAVVFSGEQPAGTRSRGP